MSRFSSAGASCVIFLFALAMSQAAWSSSPGVALDVNITKIKNSKGKLVVALFDSKEKFLKETVSEYSLEIADDGCAIARFEDIPPGTYAIAAYHDKNADGKLNTFMLVPREDYGFSNDARSMFGPPSFKSASFVVGEQDIGIEFRVR
jgi:uncharacterized protein (DUF2141 family)